MAHLSDQPVTSSPSVEVPLITVETKVSEMQHAVLHGIGTAFGLAIGGYLLYVLIGKRVV